MNDAMNTGPRFTESDRAKAYAEIAEAASKGESAGSIAKRYGISRGMASRIIRMSKAKATDAAA